MTIFAKGIGHFFRMRRRYAYKLVVGIALLLLCASWLPGRFMVRTEILSGQAEHAVAYFLTGLTVTLVLVGCRKTWHIVLGLVLYAGVLELGQHFVPGRHASFGDFIASAAGGLAGVAMSALLIQAYSRMSRDRRPQPSNPRNPTLPEPHGDLA